MSLLQLIQRNRMPQVGEVVRVYQHHRVIARGQVICADMRSVSIAGKGIVDLDTDELRRGLHDGSIRIERDTQP